MLTKSSTSGTHLHYVCRYTIIVCTNVLVQLVPFPEYPFKQVQVKLLNVSIHMASGWQSLSSGKSHSFIANSENKGGIIQSCAN